MDEGSRIKLPLIIGIVVIIIMVTAVLPGIQFGVNGGNNWNVLSASDYLNTRGYTVFATGGLTAGGVPVAQVDGTLATDSGLSYNFGTDTLTTSHVSAPTGRTATYVIAASDAPAHVKAQADYICDGTADEVEINIALALLTNGGKVSLLSGNYVLADSILIKYSHTNLEGVGWSTGIHMGDAQATSVVKNFDQTSNLRSIVVANLRIDGSCDHVSPATGKVVNMTALSDFTLDNVRIDRGGGAEVFACGTLQDSTTTVAEDVDSSETSIDVADGTKFVTNEVIFINATADADSEAMYITNVAGNTLTVVRGLGGVATTHANGVKIWEDTGDTTKQMTIRRCSLALGNHNLICFVGRAYQWQIVDNMYIGEAYGASVQDAIYLYNVQQGEIKGNIIDDAGLNGIWSKNSQKLQIANNQITSCQQAGIAFVGSTADSVILGNVFAENGVSNTNACGIYFANTANSIVISNNRIGDYSTTVQDYGIIIGAATDHDFTITGNDLSGNYVSPVSITAGAYNLMWSNNRGYIALGEVRTYSGTITTLTENAFNSVDNPFGQAVRVLSLDINVSTGATATTPNIDCGVGSSATTDYATMFDDLPGETIGYYRSTIATPGTQTVPVTWASGSGDRYLNMSIKGAAATGMVATYTVTVMGN